jgi:hypothetical protein
LPQRWMKEHPLTLEDLEQERQYLKDAVSPQLSGGAAREVTSATRSS